MRNFKIKNNSVFFGYYDLNPVKENKHLFHQTEITDRLPRHNEQAKLGYFNWHSFEHTTFAKTSAWNWQQGSRLQWLNDQTIIYNDIVNNNLIGKRYNINTGQTDILLSPVYLSLKSTSLILSVNYSKITKYREAYGYFTKFKDVSPEIRNAGPQIQ